MFFKINEICQKSDCTQETVRYYEKVGLLPKPKRSANGYRIYSDETVNLLRFIKTCRSLGFSVEETRQFIQLRNTPTSDCYSATELVQLHLLQVKEKIAQLIEIESFLQNLALRSEQCEQNCEVLAGIENSLIETK